MGPELVVVRRARAGDAAARGEVLRDALRSNTKEAFFYFFFHETTLQAVVLAGAGLFIFLGCGLLALASLPPLAAVVVLAAAHLAHELAATRQTHLMALEAAGWVAERRGPPRPPGTEPASVRVEIEEADGAGGTAPRGRGQIVGTVSLCSCRDAPGVWLHALGVRAAWRRRGVGRALEAAARGAARRAGHAHMHAVTSQLQVEARALLHDNGWQCSGVYSRPLLGTALTLPLARLERELGAPA